MQTITTQQPAGCAAILDPISLNRAVRVAFGGLDTPASLFVFAVSLLFALATGAVWWQYDLLSTWKFSQGVNGDVQPVADIIAQKATQLGDVTLGAFIGGAIVVAITLAPSIVELIAPRVLHPGVQLALNLTILFDFITDAPTAMAIVGRYEVPLGWFGWALAVTLVTLMLSLIVQILFVLALTAMLTSAANILRLGGRSAMRGVITIDQ